jgi:hypothetical protein
LLHKINIIVKFLSEEANHVWFNWLDQYTKEY